MDCTPWPSMSVPPFSERPGADDAGGKISDDDLVPRMTDRPGDELIQALLRWQQSGAVWRVLQHQPTLATVALLRCDAGEEVERLTSDDPVWLEYLHGRDGSDD
jgi:hypothetical protein